MSFSSQINTSDVKHSKELDFSPNSSNFKSSGYADINSVRNLMLFDLSLGGHHPAYIEHLLRYWCEQEFLGKLDIVVLPKFIEQHSDVVDIALNYPQKNVNFVAITLEEAIFLKPRHETINRAWRAFQEWYLLHKYAAALEAEHCLIMYFDTCEYPLVLGASLPCQFSGIYFRPTFHYSDFANYTPSRRERFQQWREKLSLFRILHNPQLQTLFCLDPFVNKYIDKFHTEVTAVHLPDPVRVSCSSQFELGKLKELLGIHPDRQVFLLFGSLTDRRKGMHQILKAVSLLPQALCQKLCLLFVGEADPRERISLESQIVAVCKSRPVQIISRYEFVPEQDVQTYFQLADVVMAPYQRHVGMSGILLLAAAAQKPILSSNYGLMGEIVRLYSLGITVDSTLPSEIAKGLTRFLIESLTNLYDRAKMKHFAEQNSVDKFAEVIFQHIYR